MINKTKRAELMRHIRRAKDNTIDCEYPQFWLVFSFRHVYFFYFSYFNELN